MTNWAWTQIASIWDWISMSEFVRRWVCFQRSSKFCNFMVHDKVTLNLMPRSSFWLLRSTVGNFCSKYCNRSSKDIFHYIFCRYYTSHFVWRCIFFCQICHKIVLLFALYINCNFQTFLIMRCFSKFEDFISFFFQLFFFILFLIFCRNFSTIQLGLPHSKELSYLW